VSLLIVTAMKMTAANSASEPKKPDDREDAEETERDVDVALERCSIVGF
jgi:hypothetical protein